MSLESKVDALTAEVAEIKKILAETVAQKYAWDEKVSETGIQIAGGPTTVTHQGTLMGTGFSFTPQGPIFVFILKDEKTKKYAILSPELVRPVL